MTSHVEKVKKILKFADNEFFLKGYCEAVKVELERLLIFKKNDLAGSKIEGFNDAIEDCEEAIKLAEVKEYKAWRAKQK